MRRWFRRPSLYAGGALALLLALPVILWNFERGWPSLRLHFVERAGVGVPVAGENTVNHLVEVASTPGTSALQSVLRVLVGQLMSYSPLLAPLLVVGLVRVLRGAWSDVASPLRAARRTHDDRNLFLVSFSWPILLVLLGAMLKLKDAEQHWTMVAFIPALIAAGHYADVAWSRGAKRASPCFFISRARASSSAASSSSWRSCTRTRTCSSVSSLAPTTTRAPT